MVNRTVRRQQTVSWRLILRWKNDIFFSGTIHKKENHRKVVLFIYMGGTWSLRRREREANSPVDCLPRADERGGAARSRRIAAARRSPTPATILSCQFGWHPENPRCRKASGFLCTHFHSAFLIDAKREKYRVDGIWTWKSIIWGSLRDF